MCRQKQQFSTNRRTNAVRFSPTGSNTRCIPDLFRSRGPGHIGKNGTNILKISTAVRTMRFEFSNDDLDPDLFFSQCHFDGKTDLIQVDGAGRVQEPVITNLHEACGQDIMRAGFYSCLVDILFVFGCIFLIAALIFFKTIQFLNCLTWRFTGLQGFQSL